MPEKHRPLYRRAWGFLCYAARQTVSFIKRHWRKILMLVILIALAWISYPLFARAVTSASSFGNEIRQTIDTARDIKVGLEQPLYNVNKYGQWEYSPDPRLDKHIKGSAVSAGFEGWSHFID